MRIRYLSLVRMGIIISRMRTSTLRIPLALTAVTERRAITALRTGQRAGMVVRMEMTTATGARAQLIWAFITQALPTVTLT